MNNQSNYEILTRGTPDFQVELYDLTDKHPRYHMQYHWHNNYEIVYVVSGSFTMLLNGKRIILREGESVFIPDGVVHGGTPSNCRYICVVFHSSILHAAQCSRLIMQTQITMPVILKNDNLIKNIIKDLTEKNPGYELSVIGNLYLLVHRLLQNHTDNKIPPNPNFEKLKPAITFIEKNFSNTITLTELAAECSLSPNYFCRCFKALTSETPFGYITRYRIEIACEFLISGMSITDTAYSCGFNDISYFINIFKQHMGISPKKYQLQYTKLYNLLL